MRTQDGHRVFARSPRDGNLVLVVLAGVGMLAQAALAEREGFIVDGTP